MEDEEQKRDRRRRERRWMLAAALLGGLVLLLVMARLHPMAPRRITLLTGPVGSTYHAQGLQYAAGLKRHGITAEVVVTQGALDNLERLITSEGAVVGFAQSGIERELGDRSGLEELESLGSLAFEPLWLFVGEDSEMETVADLAECSVALGPKRSGSRAIALKLLDANGIQDRVNTEPFDQLEDHEAKSALQSNSVSAVFVAGGVQSPIVAELFSADGIRVMPFARAPTYAALVPSLASFEVLPGMMDLARNRPPRKVPLVAATTNLVARAGLHGAAVQALLDTARIMQARPTPEVPAGRFPTIDYISLPPNAGAQRFYQDGPTRASRILPYWAAAVVDQIVFVVLPALAVVFAVLKTVPFVIGLRFDLRSVRLCRRLVAAEKGVLAGGDPGCFRSAIEKADLESAAMQVPPPKAASYLELRQNLHDARERLAMLEESRASRPG